MAVLYVLCGMPGSGKSTFAEAMLKNYSEEDKPLYANPDVYYHHVNGDDRNRSNTFEVWMSMFRDINTAMHSGRSVIVDSDNLTYAQRNQWIEWFPNFDRYELTYFDVPLEECIKRVDKRRRTIPHDTMEAKFKKWQMPLDNPMTDFEKKEWDMISLGVVYMCFDYNEKLEGVYYGHYGKHIKYLGQANGNPKLDY